MQTCSLVQSSNRCWTRFVTTHARQKYPPAATPPHVHHPVTSHLFCLLPGPVVLIPEILGFCFGGVDFVMMICCCWELETMISVTVAQRLSQTQYELKANSFQPATRNNVAIFQAYDSLFPSSCLVLCCFVRSFVRLFVVVVVPVESRYWCVQWSWSSENQKFSVEAVHLERRYLLQFYPRMYQSEDCCSVVR